MKLFRLLIAATILTLMFSFLAIQTPAYAATDNVDRVTKSDVIRILYGGAKANTMKDYQRAAITPLASHNGAHFCVNDWHLVRVGLGENIDYVTTFTKDQVIDDLKSYNVTLYLDGVVLPSKHAPLFTTIAADGTKIWWIQYGSILAPADISVGDHTASVLFSNPTYGDDFHTSTFTVDASGTGACLQP